jgi:hypothetical protein
MWDWAFVILGIIALVWYMRPLRPVGDFTLVATDAAVGKATRFDGINIAASADERNRGGSGIRNVAECAAVARDYDNVVAMYQAPIYQTGGYGKSGVKKTAPGYCLAFKTTEGLSLVAGATPGQTVMAKMGSVPGIQVNK